MEKKKHQEEIIELLARHEEKVGELYKTYSEKFPAHIQFWKVLYIEEQDHAAWVRRLFAKIDEGLLRYNEGRFKIKVINKSLEYLQEVLTQAQERTPSLTDALSIAIDIECSLIENKFFEAYDTDSPELKQLLQALESAYCEHRDRLQDALDKSRLAEG